MILMTAYGTIETAVEAMKKGAYDYVIKPFSPDQIELLISRINERQKLIVENRYWRSNANIDEKCNPVFSKNSKMSHIYEQVKKIAQSKASVLIQGKSGTGKELIARAIHLYSPRAEKPFIRVNCAALAETLLESELFGHERGAYTGAVSRHAGRSNWQTRARYSSTKLAKYLPTYRPSCSGYWKKKSLSGWAGKNDKD